MKEIKKRLRLSMNGVVSTAMREKGMKHKLNFGVDIPRLRQMAKEYTPDLKLANDLWKEDIRELKILATLLCPVEDFKDADVWVKEIDNLELAEQACMNCFSKLPDARQKAYNWILSDELYVKISGFLLYARLFSKDYIFEGKEKEQFLSEASQNLQNESLHLRNASVTALKRLGRQSLPVLNEILQAVDNLEFDDIQLKEEFIKILKFEYDYYSNNQ